MNDGRGLADQGSQATLDLGCLLDRPPQETGWQQWRDAEEALFVLMELLRRGHLPDPAAVKALPRSGLRRLGYLADLVLVHLDPVDPTALAAVATAAQRSLPAVRLATAEAVSAVPWPTRRNPHTTYDGVGAKWSVAPGIDLSRWRAEIPALRAVRPELQP